MLSCCAGHRLLALQKGLRRLPATQQDLCSKVSHILLRQLHAPIADTVAQESHRAVDAARCKSEPNLFAYS